MHAGVRRSATAAAGEAGLAPVIAQIDLTYRSSRAARGAAGVVVALHLVLLLVCQWFVFLEFRRQTPGIFHDALAARFATRTAGILTIEAAALALSAVAATAALKRFASRRHAERIAVLLLLSYVPIAVYTYGVLLAFGAGWQLDVWVLWSPGATDADVAATLGDAIPIITSPLDLGRHAANTIAAILFAALLRRRERASRGRAAAAAALVALVLTLILTLTVLVAQRL
jgi:hypothetical protein